MQGHRLEKIVVATGVGKLRQRPRFEEDLLPEIIKELGLITGQKPKITKAKQSVAGFKVREGDIVGLKVTLRGKRMKDFLIRLIGFVLPRIRDFRGLDPKSIDAQGNLTIPIREHIVFPEINSDEVKVDFGLEVTLVTGTKNPGEALKIYQELGLPLKQDG
ncbi:MAG: 50S ribosomal protein L5 [Candidatus Colwellbacteria bacterium]|nr:50S ribosomal protein L5 [Candidatus Colwellbacteria bacterium]